MADSGSDGTGSDAWSAEFGPDSQALDSAVLPQTTGTKDSDATMPLGVAAAILPGPTVGTAPVVKNGFTRPDRNKFSDVNWYVEPMWEVVQSWTLSVPCSSIVCNYRDMCTGSNTVALVLEVCNSSMCFCITTYLTTWELSGFSAQNEYITIRCSVLRSQSIVFPVGLRLIPGGSWRFAQCTLSASSRFVRQAKGVGVFICGGGWSL
jgi:hypothetical protein